MKIYIIRHGQTEWNLEGTLQGSKNSNLTEKGVSDAKRLSKRLEDVKFDYIYSSPQERAFKTADIIKGNRNKNIIKLNGLKEIGFGKWEGMKIEDIETKYKDEYDTYKNRPHLYNPTDGSETFEEIYKRVEGSLKTIIDNGGEEVLLVTHGITIKVIISIIKQIPLEEIYKIPVHIGTALNICEVNGDKIEFTLEGDTSHMK